MMTSDSSRQQPASLPLSLRRNFSWTFVGNVVYAASQWGMLVVLARVGTPEMVGQFALGLAVTAPVILFANLALRQVQATDATREYAFGDYFSLRIVTTLLAMAMILFIALSAYQNETVLVIVLIGVAKSFEALSDVVYGLLQQRERMDRVAQSYIIKGPASLIALAAGVLLTGSVVGGVVGMVLVWSLLFLTYDLNSARLLVENRDALRPQWNPRRLMKLAWLALPLGFVMMLISLNTNIPRIFVERYLGEAQLGIYAAMAYLMVAGNTVVSALGQAVSPRLAAYYARGDTRAYGRLLLRLTMIGAGLGLAGVIVAVVAGELVLHLMYGPEYAAEADVFVWIMISAAVAYIGSFMGYGVTAARVFKLQLVLSGLPALAALGLSMLLIPEQGLYGAAIVLILTNLVTTLLKIPTLFWIVKKAPSMPMTGESV